MQQQECLLNSNWKPHVYGLHPWVWISSPHCFAWFLLASSKCYISPCCTNIKDEFSWVSLTISNLPTLASRDELSKEDWPALVIATWYFFNSWCNFSIIKDAFSWAIRFSTSECCWSKQKWNSSITQVHGCNVPTAPMQLNVIKLLQQCSNILIWVAMALLSFLKFTIHVRTSIWSCWWMSLKIFFWKQTKTNMLPLLDLSLWCCAI